MCETVYFYDLCFSMNDVIVGETIIVDKQSYVIESIHYHTTFTDMTMFHGVNNFPVLCKLSLTDVRKYGLICIKAIKQIL